MMRIPRVPAPFLLCLASIVLLAGGCRDKPTEPTTIVLDGVIEKIDLPGQEITVRYYAEKQKTERKQKVRFNIATEVLINGALARLEDIRVGERARGEVLIEQSADDMVYTAKRVEIRRAEPLKPTPAVPGEQATDS